MTGPEALAAFNASEKLRKEGRFEEALAVPMKPSDRQVVENRIAAAKQAASANTTKERT